jgi:hypothetical protein
MPEPNPEPVYVVTAPPDVRGIYDVWETVDRLQHGRNICQMLVWGREAAKAGPKLARQVLQMSDQTGPAGPRVLRQRLTITTSYSSAVGGNPVSNFAFTAARLLPCSAAVVGIWNALLVITFSSLPERRSLLSRIAEI